MDTTWEVFSEGDLSQVVRRIDVEVPGRAAGRTKAHTERYAFARLLLSLRSELSFPLTISHRDRPDFVLTMPGGQIGVEHAEVVPENVAHAAFLREKGQGSKVYPLPRAALNEPKKSAAQIKREIADDLPSSPWYGDAPERETASALASTAQIKVRVAQKEGFARFSANWLLLYSNWPAPMPDLNAVAFLAQSEMASVGVFAVFERVFVICGCDLLDLNAVDPRVIQVFDPRA